jgi:hypothetical protein
MLEAVIDQLFADDVARACGWELPGEPGTNWQPLNATPVTVALGCRMLIASARFEPKPSEVRQAVIAAGRQVTLAQAEAERLRQAVIELDAILLQQPTSQERDHLQNNPTHNTRDNQEAQ